jgi:hypothetical protein
MPKYCKGKCGHKLSYQNKTGYCKECFGRLILSPKGANASRRDTSKPELFNLFDAQKKKKGFR